jgi:hypothetical protein
MTVPMLHVASARLKRALPRGPTPRHRPCEMAWLQYTAHEARRLHVVHTWKASSSHDISGECHSTHA